MATLIITILCVFFGEENKSSLWGYSKIKEGHRLEYVIVVGNEKVKY